MLRKNSAITAHGLAFLQYASAMKISVKTGAVICVWYFFSQRAKACVIMVRNMRSRLLQFSVSISLRLSKIPTSSRIAFIMSFPTKCLLAYASMVQLFAHSSVTSFAPKVSMSPELTCSLSSGDRGIATTSRIFLRIFPSSCIAAIASLTSFAPNPSFDRLAAAVYTS